MKYFDQSVQRDENIHIGKLILSLWKYKAYFGIATLIAIVFTGLILLLVPKEYMIEGRLQLISNNSDMGSELKAIKSSGLGGMLGGGSGSGINSEDETAIILSRQILTQTIIQNNLQIDMTERKGLKKISYYKNNAPYKLIFTPNFLKTFPESITLNIQQRQEQAKIKISSKSIKEETISTSKFPINLSTQWGNIIVEKGPEWTNDADIEIQLNPIQLAFEQYQKMLIIRPIDLNSDILQVAILSNNKPQGIAIVDALMQNYILYSKSVKQQESYINQKFVEEKLQQVSAELNQLEKDIELYKRQNKIPEIQAYGTVTYSGSETTNKRLLETQIDLNMLNDAIAYLKNPKNEYAIAPNIEHGAEALTAYNQLMFKRIELLKSSEPSNVAVELINDQLREQRKVLLSTLQAARRNLEFLISEIHKENNNYLERLNELPAQEKKYIEMVRLQRTQEALYLFLLQKKQEKEIANAPDEQAARILDYAYCSYKHTFPKGSIILPLSLALCFIIALLVASIKEFILRKTIRENDIPDLIDIAPWGTFTNAESVKRLRKLIYDQNQNKGIFLITSSIPNEGKTFFATNLVKALNEMGHKAILYPIDSSISYPSLSKEIIRMASEYTHVFILAPSLAESALSYDLSQNTDYTFFLCRIGITTKNDLHNLNQEIRQQTLGKIALIVNQH